MALFSFGLLAYTAPDNTEAKGNRTKRFVDVSCSMFSLHYINGPNGFTHRRPETVPGNNK